MPEDQARRIEVRYLGNSSDSRLHYVDVPNRSTVAACGLTVDSFSQWEKFLGDRPLALCLSCARRLPPTYT